MYTKRKTKLECSVNRKYVQHTRKHNTLNLEIQSEKKSSISYVFNRKWNEKMNKSKISCEIVIKKIQIQTHGADLIAIEKIKQVSI